MFPAATIHATSTRKAITRQCPELYRAEPSRDTGQICTQGQGPAPRSRDSKCAEPDCGHVTATSQLVAVLLHRPETRFAEDGKGQNGTWVWVAVDASMLEQLVGMHLPTKQREQKNTSKRKIAHKLPNQISCRWEEQQRIGKRGALFRL
jgi:hypothetical protein